MKNLLALLLLLACISQACGKKNKVQWYEGPPYLKIFTDGKENEMDYLFLSGININSQYVLNDTDKRFIVKIAKSVDANAPPPRHYWETFSIYFVYKKMGRQVIKGASFDHIADHVLAEYRTVTDTTPVFGYMFTNQEEGEFTCERIEVNNEAGDNWIEIQKEEGNFKKIWGKLHMNMKVAAIENGCPNPKYPANFKVTGDFYLEL